MPRRILLNPLFLASVSIGGFVTVLNNIDADLGVTFGSNPPKAAQKDKVVWIVGASSGIGAALAVDFAKDGAKVVISSRREKQLKDVAERCRQQGGKSPTVLPLDVNNFECHEKAVRSIIDEHGKIDIVVLNAGFTQRSLAVDTPLKVTEDIIKTNFLSYVSLTKNVLPSMAENKGGKIIVLSSIAGLMGVPISTSYSASKFALQGFFNGLRSEVAPDNIQISIVCPGPVESEIASNAHKNPNLPDNEGKKMPTERCTSLIMKGLWNNRDEMWISESPYLLMTYLAVYFPGFARRYVDTKVGPERITALKTGQAIYGNTSKK
eukprot:gene2516-2673_t